MDASGLSISSRLSLLPAGFNVLVIVEGRWNANIEKSVAYRVVAVKNQRSAKSAFCSMNAAIEA